VKESRTTVGILLFENAEELDFVGPWEVFASARLLTGKLEVVTIAEKEGPIRAAKGMRVIPDTTFARAPELDVLVVPGGDGRRKEVDNEVVISWIKKTAASCAWVTSVCTGAFLLHRAGLLQGKTVTTHWARADELEALGGISLRRGDRYVRDGNLVTAAGVSAGIDMSLWLIGALFDPETARRVQKSIEYDPAPPYTAEL
jgi:transcriptional regulator GlxA family with amidase domain